MKAILVILMCLVASGASYGQEEGDLSVSQEDKASTIAKEAKELPRDGFIKVHSIALPAGVIVYVVGLLASAVASMDEQPSSVSHTSSHH